MRTTVLHILKNLSVFWLFIGIGIMEPDLAAANTYLEQEVCEIAGHFGGFCVDVQSRESNNPRVRSKASGRSPDVRNKSSGHDGTFIPDEYWCGIAATSPLERFLIRVQGKHSGKNLVPSRAAKAHSDLFIPSSGRHFWLLDCSVGSGEILVPLRHQQRFAC
jgi:hypothetical protein